MPSPNRSLRGCRAVGAGKVCTANCESFQDLPTRLQGHRVSRSRAQGDKNEFFPRWRSDGGRHRARVEKAGTALALKAAGVASARRPPDALREPSASFPGSSIQLRRSSPLPPDSLGDVGSRRCFIPAKGPRTARPFLLLDDPVGVSGTRPRRGTPSRSARSGRHLLRSAASRPSGSRLPSRPVRSA